jgi:hypothetical protein
MTTVDSKTINQKSNIARSQSTIGDDATRRQSFFPEDLGNLKVKQEQTKLERQNSDLKITKSWHNDDTSSSKSVSLIEDNSL